MTGTVTVRRRRRRPAGVPGPSGARHIQAGFEPGADPGSNSGGQLVADFAARAAAAAMSRYNSFPPMAQSKKRSRSILPASFYEQLEANKRLNFESESQEWRKSYSKINGVRCLVVTEKANVTLTEQASLTISPAHSVQTVVLVQASNQLGQTASVIKVTLSWMQ